MSPVVRIERQDDDTFQISGDGFDAGHYDVDVNGSLVISNVTTQSERIYNALLVDELYTAYMFTVKVISVGKSMQHLQTKMCVCVVKLFKLLI